MTKSKVQDYLGASKFHSELAERTTEPAVVTGLAWTAAGGDITLPLRVISPVIAILDFILFWVNSDISDVNIGWITAKR